jgi:D-alanyl-D-alanine carboxypeptidase/D-alanyl-D-alanine-endopeptidase (penicillin-binding protein 4)
LSHAQPKPINEPPMIACRRQVLLSLSLAAGLIAPSIAAQSLARRLDARLDAPDLNRHLWGVAIADANGRLLYGRNADRLFIPASNAKLVVAAVATAMLGPDFTVRTSLYGAGPVVEGELRGDLVLYGRGDPTFSKRCYDIDDTRAGACDNDPAAKLRDLARQLRERGILRVNGDLVGDGSYFDDELVHPAWETYDLNWWYAAPVSALGFNDNALDVVIEAADSGEVQPRISMGPEIGMASLDNRALIGPRGVERTFDVIRSRDGTRYVASGVLPLGATRRTEYAAVTDPGRFTALALRRELLAEGIVVMGTVRGTVDSTDFAVARATPSLAEVVSRPLRDWVFPVLNTSQNWFAEMLVKQLGRQFGQGGSWREGTEVERRFLIDSVGIDSTQFALVDASGLASNNLVSPLALTRLLGWMRRHPTYDAFAAGLPQSGAAGSLRRRFIGTPLEGRVRAKTGSISRVNTLSGYVERADGQVLIFSIQANHHTLGSARMIPAIDSVVVELAKRP